MTPSARPLPTTQSEGVLPAKVSSDLWLPSMVFVLLLLLLLSLRWLWSHGQIWRINKRLNPATPLMPMSVNALAESTLSGSNSNNGIDHYLEKFRNMFDSVGDLTAFTAQKNPVVLEERVEHLSVNEASFSFENIDRIEPVWVFDNIDNTFAPSQPELEQSLESNTCSQSEFKVDNMDRLDTLQSLSPLQKTDAVPASVQPTLETTSQIMTTLVATQPPEPAFMAHEVFHYQARLSWPNDDAKAALTEALEEHPWVHHMPVQVCADTDEAYKHSAILAWQVIHRHELATINEFPRFKNWCETIAMASKAQCQIVSTNNPEAFIAEAKSLLLLLDSAVILKLSVPTVQLDIFAQSLLAARFVQQQEHWVYSDIHRQYSICLERLWQAASHTPNVAIEQSFSNSLSTFTLNDQAVFQIIIDLPHLDVLEARKVYMRIRAVAKASSAILQAVNGTHLSEGILDRYSREMLLRQESLSNAGVIPGSSLAQAVFQPKLNVNQDLYHKKG
jgi:hypothetical protein